MSEIKRWEEAGQWVEIDYSLCDGIAKCVDICPVSVYSLVERKVVAENISECIACQDLCPMSAIIQHWAWT
jgi:ferredoxin